MLHDFDAKDFLEDEEDCRLYLKACFDEDPSDGSLIKKALDDIAQAHGMALLAKEAGMTRAELYKALDAESDPKLSTFLHILKAQKIDLSPNMPARHATV